MLWELPLYLLAIGTGYFVALKATEEVGLLRQLGNIIAVVMIVGSLLGIGLGGYLCFAKCGGNAGWKCPFQKTMPVQEVK